MKTVLFIPGYREGLTSRDYQAVLDAIQSKGYNVRFVPINWNRTTIVEWETEFNIIYSSYIPKNTIIAGFSFGAVTAFMAASHRGPAALWLFSLSPYFRDDIRSKNMKQTWLNEFGKHRVTAFSELDFAAIASNIKCPVILLAGSKELSKYAVLNERFTKASNTLSKCDSQIVEDADHDVSDPRYIAAIVSNI